MMNIGKNETSTGIVISEDVIEKVVSIAALEISGVSAVAVNKDIKGIISNKSAKPVRVKIGDGFVEIDVNLKLQRGVKIAQVCEQVQENVKTSVQNITSYAVSKVNIHVVDIDLNQTEIQQP